MCLNLKGCVGGGGRTSFGERLRGLQVSSQGSKIMARHTTFKEGGGGGGGGERVWGEILFERVGLEGDRKPTLSLQREWADMERIGTLDVWRNEKKG